MEEEGGIYREEVRTIMWSLADIYVNTEGSWSCWRTTVRKRIKRTAAEKAAAQARIAELREHARRIEAELEERRRAREAGGREAS